MAEITKKSGMHPLMISTVRGVQRMLGFALLSLRVVPHPTWLNI
jgi:hypothetical protein